MTITGLPVTLEAVDENGAVFVTNAGRQMDPVPLDQLERAIDHLEKGYDISTPWRLRVYAKVDLPSYVWALLHDSRFRDRLQKKTRQANFRPVIAPDGDVLVIRTRFGIADPRLPALDATWDEARGGWTRPRGDAELRRLVAALPDERPDRSPVRSAYAIDADASILVFTPYSEKETLPRLPGRSWEPDQRCWRYPRTVQAATLLLEAFGERLLVSESLRELAGLRPKVGVAEGGPTPSLAQPATVLPAPPRVSAVEVGREPWSSATERAPWEEWLAGRLEKIRLELEDAASEHSSAAIAALVAAGRFEEALESMSGVQTDSPLDSALVLAAAVCAPQRARHPGQLVDVDPGSVRGAPPIDLATAALRVTCERDAQSGLALAALLALCQAEEQALVEEWFRRAQGRYYARAQYLGVYWAAMRGRDSAASGRDVVTAAATACTSREWANVTLAAWANEKNELLADLLRYGLPVILQRGRVEDLSSDVLEPLDAGEILEAAWFPELVAAVARSMEAGQMVEGYAPADITEAVYRRAYGTAERFEAGQLIREGWERLLRWYQERGDFPAALSLAEEQRHRAALQGDAEIATAYVLAEYDDLAGAVGGLVRAYLRRRAVAEEEATRLLDEARFLARHDHALLAQVEEATPSRRHESAPALTWPTGERALIVGGSNGLRQRGRETLESLGIDYTWVTTEEAKRGQEVVGQVRGNATLVALLTPHIPHSVSYRVEAAAEPLSKRVLPFTGYGVSRLGAFLLEAAHGRQAAYRPHGI